jgi:hypothetical protein
MMREANVGNANPVEALWSVASLVTLVLVLWLAWDVLVDAKDVFLRPNAYRPHRLKQALLNLGVVALMAVVLVGFVALGAVSMTAPQSAQYSNLSPMQAIITLFMFSVLAWIAGLSLYWRWMRGVYLRDEDGDPHGTGDPAGRVG